MLVSQSIYFLNFIKLLRFSPLLLFLSFFLFYLTLYLIDLDVFFIFVIIAALFQAFVIFKGAVDSIRALLYHQKYFYIDFKKKYLMNKTPKCLEWDDIKFYYLIPHYKEDYNVIKGTLECITMSKQIDVKKQVIVILCCEERENNVEKKAKSLVKAFKDQFFDIYYTIHPKGLKDEIKAKSSNLFYASQSIPDNIKKHDLEEENLLILSSDCDSLIDEKYLSAVSYKFCTQEDRYKKVYGAPLDMGVNLYDIPFITRICTIIANYSHYGWCSARNMDHFSQSTYASSYIAAKSGNFWNPSYICDDFHFYLNLSFLKKGDFYNDLIPFPIKGYSLNSSSWFKTCKERIIQGHRQSFSSIDELVYFLRETSRILYLKQDFPMPIRRWLSLFYTLTYKHFAALVQTLTLFCILINVTINTLLNKMYPNHFTWVLEVKNNMYFIIFRYVMFATSISGLVFVPFYNAYYRTNGIKKREISFLWRVFNYQFIYIFVRTVIELVIGVQISTFFFVFIPLYWASVHKCISENIEFKVASKVPLQSNDEDGNELIDDDD